MFAALTDAAPDDAIIAVDVGNNTYSFGRYFECKSQRVLMSGYLGSIGFSLPAAMGAWAATQEDDPRFHGRPVVSISGDGGFGQYMGELLTAVKYGMNITHVLLNNNELGNNFGNLINRVISFTHKYFDGVVPEWPDEAMTDLDRLKQAKDA